MPSSNASVSPARRQQSPKVAVRSQPWPVRYFLEAVTSHPILFDKTYCLSKEILNTEYRTTFLQDTQDRTTMLKEM
jgi:hypothetical protein